MDLEKLEKCFCYLRTKRLGEKMSVYTRKGDQGKTDMLSGNRVNKSNSYIEIIGNLDELSGHLGFARTSIELDTVKSDIQGIQQRLIDIMAVISCEFKNQINLESDIKELELQIDDNSKLYPHINKFITPGDDEQSARLDIARTVTRRAERQLIKLNEEVRIPEDLLKYINRLSDYLYTLARMIEFREKVKSKVLNILNKEEIHNTKIEKMTLQLAKDIAEEVENKASSMGCKVIITIVNKDGTPILSHVMDDSYLVSYGLSRKKAYTSAALKMPNHELANLTKKGAPFEGLEDMVDEDIVTLGGGWPITSNDTVIGAIGVSGSTAENDIEFARFGAAYIERVTR